MDFASLAPAYTLQLQGMYLQKDISSVLTRVLSKYRAGCYGAVSQKTGVPTAFIAAIFEREAASNFTLSLAQGDPWDRASTHVPKGRGPFASWEAAAVDALTLQGLDKVRDWSWEKVAFHAEQYNGWGYHYRNLPSPYLWGGTDLQRAGKFVADGQFDPTVIDSQMGIIPLVQRLVQAEPNLSFTTVWPFPRTKMAVKAKGLNFRSSPQVADNLIGAPLVQGATVTTGNYMQGDWIETFVNGVPGWVNKKYLASFS